MIPIYTRWSNSEAFWTVHGHLSPTNWSRWSSWTSWTTPSTRKFRYSNFLIVAANVVKLMADYVITASGNSNLLRPSVLCLGNRGATT